VLGPNGAGKSTLLKVLLGLLAPSRGEARVLGLDARRHRLQIRSRVGFAPEDDCTFPRMEGVVAVTHAARLCGLSFPDALGRAHEVLEFVGMGEERYRETSTYSTGMKQQLKLAQALVHDPELLILDEPTNGVDPAHRDDLLALIGELVPSGLRLIVSSHLLADVEDLCEAVIVVDRGQVVEMGLIEELRARGVRRYRLETTGDGARLGEALRQGGWEVTPAGPPGCFDLSAPDDAPPDQVGRLAAELGVGLRRLELERDSLQDVFLRALARHRQETEEGTA
jgi:ABC-2 type transport system ATP-binding protein